MLLHIEFEHDFELYDACAMAYNSEIEDCTPSDYGVTVTV